MLFPAQLRRVAARAILVAAVLVTGCAGAPDAPAPDGIRIDLDRKGERQLLEFYLGGYLSPQAGDPFAAGLIVESDGGYVIPDSVFASESGRNIRGLEAAGSGDSLVDWDEFEAFILDTWPEARDAPESVEAARDRYGDWSDDGAWFTIELTGSMSPYRRRIAVEYSALRAAIDALSSLDDPVIYPIGTVFVGEHLTSGSEGAVVETTFMVKRADGLWDYFAYGADGRWARSIRNEPTDLNVPTQCVGCHFGSRQFEPERSFPAEARPGPAGPRLIHVEPGLRTAGIAERLREHLRRSDTILGLYATLYLSRIRSANPEARDDWERSTRARLLAD